MIRRLWGRLGLRARITGLYALGGLLLSLTIALSTLTLARQNLVEDREERAFSVAVRNAQRVENGLGAETEIEDVGVLLDNLTITEGSFPLLQVGDATRALDQAFDADAVPSSLRELVQAGNAGRMRVRVFGGEEPVVDMSVTRGNWETTTLLLQGYMMNGSERLRTTLQINGEYTVHENEQGEMTLFPHPMIAKHFPGEVSAYPFRETWLKNGTEVFYKLETF